MSIVQKDLRSLYFLNFHLANDSNGSKKFVIENSNEISNENNTCLMTTIIFQAKFCTLEIFSNIDYVFNRFKS